MSSNPIRAVPFLLALLVLAGATPARAQTEIMPTLTNDKNSEIDHFRRNSALLGAVSLTTIAMNSEVVGPKPAPGWAGALGFFAGGFQIVLGAQMLSKDSLVASFDLFVGGAAIITSISALGGHESLSSARGPGGGVHLAPLVGVGAGLEPEAGVAVSF